MTTADFPAQAQSVEDLLAVLTAPAKGESKGFTALDHHLQCAQVLAQAYPDDKELQVAGLLHDIGHTLAVGHPERHGVVGGQYLRAVLGERVAALVELHVEAKRYLVAVEPGYRATLSMGSAQTLVAQGEAMTMDEAKAFQSKTHSADAVKLRRADEMAKVPGQNVASLASWLPVLQELARVP